jgi:hypothetical protein
MVKVRYDNQKLNEEIRHLNNYIKDFSEENEKLKA